MPRKKLVISNALPYHITARANNREEFPIPLDRVWRILTDLLHEAGVIYGMQVHNLLLMPNHFHLLASTPDENLGVIMRKVMSSTTKTINLISGRSGHVFGGKYYRTLVSSPHYFTTVYKYVYRNPVKAGMCEKVEDYKYSTLAGLIGSRPLPMPLYFPYKRTSHLFIPEEPEASLNWLNQPFRKEQDELIQKCLRKTVFAPPKEGWKRLFAELKLGLI